MFCWASRLPNPAGAFTTQAAPIVRSKFAACRRYPAGHSIELHDGSHDEGCQHQKLPLTCQGECVLKGA
eukprot:scaffold93310_cov18-Tisochrysis_lutea.AAC.1